MRSWSYHISTVLSLAAQITGNKSLIDKLATHLDKLYNMELHRYAAYDSTVEEVAPDAPQQKSVEDMFALLDRLPNAV